jgi:hypothetical protein
VRLILGRDDRHEARRDAERRPRDDAVIARNDGRWKQQRCVVRIRVAVVSGARVPRALNARFDLVLERVELIDADRQIRGEVIGAVRHDTARTDLWNHGVLIELRAFERRDPRKLDRLHGAGRNHDHQRLLQRAARDGDGHGHRLRIGDSHREIEARVDWVQRDRRPIIAADVAVAELGFLTGLRDRRRRPHLGREQDLRKHEGVAHHHARVVQTAIDTTVFEVLVST